jgi:hypothetical protein
VTRKSIKFFHYIKSRVEKASYDTYSFADVFWDPGKVKSKLESFPLLEESRLFLLSGVSKTGKKPVLSVLLALLS